MIVVICAAGLFVLVAIGLHVGSAIVVAYRFRQAGLAVRPLTELPPVSILRPVCGLDDYIEDTLRSTFRLNYPSYEVLFCVADANDPVIPLVRRLIRAHARVTAQLLIGNEIVNGNPKLDNVAKGWRAAAHDFLVMADANVLMPADYVQRLLEKWRPGTGLVCSPPVGFFPVGYAAELECAFLNTYQARWQYAADSVGLGFVQGKTMLMRRSDFEAEGGIAALGAEVAEDAAATKILSRAGLRIRLVGVPFEQPVGGRTLQEVWRRQLRWAQMRRSTFPAFYAPELLTSGLLPLALSMFIAHSLELPLASCVAALIAIWYGAEVFLAHSADWHLSWRSPLFWMLRDLMIPAIWLHGWFGNEFVWRGNRMRMPTAGERAAGRGLAEVETPLDWSQAFARFIRRGRAAWNGVSSPHAH